MKDLTLNNVLYYSHADKLRNCFREWQREHEAQKVRDDRARREAAQLEAFARNHPIKDSGPSAA